MSRRFAVLPLQCKPGPQLQEHGLPCLAPAARAQCAPAPAPAAALGARGAAAPVGGTQRVAERQTHRSQKKSSHQSEPTPRPDQRGGMRRGALGADVIDWLAHAKQSFLQHPSWRATRMRISVYLRQLHRSEGCSRPRLHREDQCFPPLNQSRMVKSRYSCNSALQIEVLCLIERTPMIKSVWRGASFPFPLTLALGGQIVRFPSLLDFFSR